mmetsp:Transcript_24454/g.21714  ORF Transcript_24454/g.21714 Transcript_24454/m.21714 type:complete len:325 (+) Transcript_24454:418-1392(+)
MHSDWFLGSQILAFAESNREITHQEQGKRYMEEKGFTKDDLLTQVALRGNGIHVMKLEKNKSEEFTIHTEEIEKPGVTITQGVLLNNNRQLVYLTKEEPDSLKIYNFKDKTIEIKGGHHDHKIIALKPSEDKSISSKEETKYEESVVEGDLISNSGDIRNLQECYIRTIVEDNFIYLDSTYNILAPGETGSFSELDYTQETLDLDLFSSSKPKSYTDIFNYPPNSDRKYRVISTETSILLQTYDKGSKSTESIETILQKRLCWFNTSEINKRDASFSKPKYVYIEHGNSYIVCSIGNKVIQWKIDNLIAKKYYYDEFQFLKVDL